jgi:hypothetical protein
LSILKVIELSAMPKGKKNRGGKNRSKATAFSSSQPQVGGFPDKQRVKLVYTDFLTKSLVSVTGIDHVYSGNGLFDPDITGTGSQPANFDDFSAIYSRYRCYGSSMDVLMSTPGSSTGTGQFFAGLAARHLSTAKVTLGNQMDVISQPMSTSMMFNGGLAVKQGSSYSPSLFMSQTASHVLGYDTVAISTDDTLGSVTSANPSHQWYWHIFASMSDQTSSGTIWIRVKITYDVEFFDRVDTTIDSSVVSVPRSILTQVKFMIRETEEKETKAPCLVQKYGVRS